MHILNDYYHIYNRGAHKAPIFLDANDYERFVALLFAANDFNRLKINWYIKDFWNEPNRDVLVEIFAYCLMPNHFHIGIKEIRENGISTFIHKILTSYTMYYNKKYDHSGTILQGNYKFKHIGNDEYFRYLIDYIHLNPYGIEEPDLNKLAKSEYYDQAVEYSKKYNYSSYKDYLGENRIQGMILRRANIKNTFS
ncbi:MAG: transposase [Candidatus Paceibacterota bacterium]|jgi:putative transposase